MCPPADGEDLSQLRSLLWDFLEASTADPRAPAGFEGGWKRGDASTWGDDGMSRVGSCGVGILSGGGVGQSAFLWACRELPGVRAAFAAVWGGNADLITSFEGFSMFPPAAQVTANYSVGAVG